MQSKGRNQKAMTDMDDHVEKKGLTRRAFLGHAAVAGAAAGIGSSLLGVPQALAAGSDWSTVDAANVVWDRETDIVFVGTGYASYCAAIEACDAGTTDFLIIDKANANAIGGNSILCAGSAQFAGTDVEKAQAANPPAGYPDTPNDTVEWMIEDSLKWGDYRANRDVLRATTLPCPETVVWLRDHLGLKFKRATTFQYGMRETVARTHQPDVCGITDTNDPNWYPGSSGISYWYVMYNYLKKKGYTLGDKVLTEHKAVRFIQAGEDGPVVGIEVYDIAGGKTIHIRTRKGVVLGSGGWKSNANMRTNWDPRLDTDFNAGGMPYVETTGEMIMAANDIGADLTGMDFVCEFRVKWGTQKYQNWDNDITHPTTGAGLTVPSNYDKAICIDIDGQRFIDEYTSNTIDAQDFCEAYACMPKPRAVWAVMDDAAAPATWKTAYANAQTQTDEQLHNTTPCVWKGMIAKGDSLEALADAMQLSGTAKTAFVAQVARYNGFVEAGVDSDFDRPAAHMTAKIATGPFWAVKAQFFAHDQMSGITVNTKGQVVKRSAHVDPNDIKPIDEQETIARLYAAGECCGGYFGNERGHGKIGIVMNAGRIAGKEVIKEEPIGRKATALAIKTSAASATHGRSVKLSGTLNGAEGVPAGSQVALYVRRPGSAKYVKVSGVMTMNAARAVGKSYKLAKKGTYYFRMQFAGTASFAPCTSKSIKVVSK
jgi:succinate dehydrogenase/fumarate reductase flavoprotein subunit